MKKKIFGVKPLAKTCKLQIAAAAPGKFKKAIPHVTKLLWSSFIFPHFEHD